MKIDEHRKAVEEHERNIKRCIDGNRHYEGIVSKSGGIRHGSGNFSVPIEKYKDVRDVFKEMKITPMITEIWID